MSAASVRLFRLFVVSYSPLALMLAIQDSKRLWPPSRAISFWVFILIAIAGFVDAYRLPRGALRRGHVTVTLARISDESGQVAAYLATYLLPFLSVKVAGWRSAAALCVYFIVLLVVFVRSDLALVNPALYIMRWRVVSAERGGERVLILVPARVAVRDGDVPAVTFGRFLVYKQAKVSHG